VRWSLVCLLLSESLLERAALVLGLQIVGSMLANLQTTQAVFTH